MTTELPLYQRVYATVLRHFSRRGTRLLLVTLGDDNSDIEMPVLPHGYSIKRLKPTDLIPWASPDYGLDSCFLKQANARGDRCVANFYHDELVGYGFVTRSYAPVTNQIAVRVDKGLIYRYKGWTHPQHRRKHLSHARGRINSRLFSRQPGQRMVSYVEPHNFPSRLTHRDVHPDYLGYCLIVRLFGKEIALNSPAVKRAGFQLVRVELPENQ